MAKVYYTEAHLSDKNGVYVLTRLEKLGDVKKSRYDIQVIPINGEVVSDEDYGVVEQVGNFELVFYKSYLDENKRIKIGR